MRSICDNQNTDWATVLKSTEMTVVDPDPVFFTPSNPVAPPQPPPRSASGLGKTPSFLRSLARTLSMRRRKQSRFHSTWPRSHSAATNFRLFHYFQSVVSMLLWHKTMHLNELRLFPSAAAKIRDFVVQKSCFCFAESIEYIIILCSWMCNFGLPIRRINVRL